MISKNMISLVMRLGAGGIIGVVFSSIGVISALVAAGLAWDLHQDRTTRQHVTGTVVTNVRRSRSYRPVVEYEVEGTRYAVTGVVGNSDPVFKVGEQVTLLVDSKEPREARIDHWTESAFGILFGGFFFIVFGGIGGVSLFRWWRSEAGASWAHASGMPVQATLVGAERDTRVRINGRSPYRIVATWQNPRDGKTYRFLSEPMWSDPSRALAGRPHVAVRVDPNNPKRYWMDLRFLIPQVS